MFLVPLLSSGCLFSAIESFLPQPFVCFAQMLSDLQHGEETLLHRSTTQRFNLIMATFCFVAFVLLDECALDLWLSWWIASGLLSGEYSFILKLEILLSFP